MFITYQFVYSKSSWLSVETARTYHSRICSVDWYCLLVLSILMKKESNVSS